MAKKKEQTDAAPEKQEQPEEKKPQRVIFVGDGEPHRQVQIGMLVIELPGAEEQRKGFETEHARLLVTNVSGYKIFNPGK